METPTNPNPKLVDIQKVSDMVHQQPGAVLVVDNAALTSTFIVLACNVIDRCDRTRQSGKKRERWLRDRHVSWVTCRFVPSFSFLVLVEEGGNARANEACQDMVGRNTACHLVGPEENKKENSSFSLRKDQF